MPLLLLNLAATTDRMAFGALSPVLATTLRLDDRELALVQGPSFGVPYGLALPLAGWLVDAIGARRALIGSVLVWTVGLIVSASAGSLALLVIGRSITGIGQAALTPAAFAMILAAAPPAQLGRSLTLFTGAGTIGRGIAFAATGGLLALFGSGAPVAPWSATLLMLAVVNLLFLLVGARRLVDGEQAPGARGAWRALAGWVRSAPVAIGAAVVSALGTVVIAQALAAWIAVVLVRGHDVLPARAALLIGVIGIVAGPVGHLGGGLLADRDRLGPWRRAGVTLLCVPAVLGFVAAPTLVLALALLAAALLASGIAGALALVRVQRLIPAVARGSANGAFMTLVAVVGISGGPLLVAMLSTSAAEIGWGLTLAVFVAALVSAMAGVVADRVCASTR